MATPGASRPAATSAPTTSWCAPRPAARAARAGTATLRSGRRGPSLAAAISPATVPARMAAASPSAPHAGLAFALRHARLLTLAAVTVVVAFVTLPIFTLPQLDADDYRYLDLVRQLRAGRVGWVMASIIENRWDHLWWIDCEQAVRFFRPTLMLSYLADDLL